MFFSNFCSFSAIKLASVETAVKKGRAAKASKTNTSSSRSSSTKDEGADEPLGTTPQILGTFDAESTKQIKGQTARRGKPLLKAGAGRGVPVRSCSVTLREMKKNTAHKNEEGNSAKVEVIEKKEKRKRGDGSSRRLNLVQVPDEDIETELVDVDEETFTCEGGQSVVAVTNAEVHLKKQGRKITNIAEAKEYIEELRIDEQIGDLLRQAAQVHNRERRLELLNGILRVIACEVAQDQAREKKKQESEVILIEENTNTDKKNDGNYVKSEEDRKEKMEIVASSNSNQEKMDVGGDGNSTQKPAIEEIFQKNAATVGEKECEKNLQDPEYVKSQAEKAMKLENETAKSTKQKEEESQSEQTDDTKNKKEEANTSEPKAETENKQREEESQSEQTDHTKNKEVEVTPSEPKAETENKPKEEGSQSEQTDDTKNKKEEANTSEPKAETEIKTKRRRK